MASRHVIVLFSTSLLLTAPAGCGRGDGPDAEQRIPAPDPDASPIEARSTDTGGSDPFASHAIPPTGSPLFATVDALARSRARSPYSPPEEPPPSILDGIGYDAYRSIRFRPEEAIWRGETPFEIQLFHPGYRYRDPVAIHLVEGDRVRDLDFRARRFRYHGEAASVAGVATPELGHAGFRVHYPMNSGASKDEVVVFLGASYFRLLGPGQVHGLSARGLAVDAGLPSGEEFPAFREFWLVRPEAGATSLTFFALLDGPSVTGAYRFDLHPGHSGPDEAAPGEDASSGEDPRPGREAAPTKPSGGTVLDVDARLYAREDIARLGVAPLTSMFLFDGNTRGAFDDFRSRVHDSHGLLARTGAGEWIWRPLSNGPGLYVTSLRDTAPKGFGLVQRNRSFGDYLDLEARYDRRPSVWVEMLEGHWGAGGVELMEIPSDSEFNDNIVASWAPDPAFLAGQRRFYRYRLVTFDRRLPEQALAQVERTRIGWDALPGEADPPPRSRRRFVVDFAGYEGGRPGEDAAPPGDDINDGAPRSVDGSGPSDSGPRPEAVLTTSAGEISDTRVQPLPEGAGWRVSFDLEPVDGRPSDMRLYVEAGGRMLTETWSYVWYPERVR